MINLFTYILILAMGVIFILMMRVILFLIREEQAVEIELGGKQLEVDEDGFIQDPDQWDQAVAASLALTEGVDDLTEDHWKVVNYLREYYLEFNMAPMIRKLCKSTGFKLKEIYDLFPSGPAKGACKVAGLPKPTGCV